MPSGSRGRPAASRLRGVRARLRRCSLCPRGCGVDRTRGERGFCGAGLLPRVASVAVHHGEEPPISGERGSGNIFFTGCNLSCIYCQNYPVSRLGVGRDMTTGELADAFLRLQRSGAHNVNLVTPTPWVPQIVEAFFAAAERGFELPVVYNTGAYERPATLRLLEGIVDVYLPDMKYGGDAEGWRYSRAPRYVASASAAIGEMLRQVGPLVTDSEGLALRGVMTRHLILPGDAGRTEQALRHVRDISPDMPVSFMYQYFPAYRAVGHPRIGRRLWRDECEGAAAALDGMGFQEGWLQEYG